MVRSLDQFITRPSAGGERRQGRPIIHPDKHNPKPNPAANANPNPARSKKAERPQGRSEDPVIRDREIWSKMSPGARRRLLAVAEKRGVRDPHVILTCWRVAKAKAGSAQAGLVLLGRVIEEYLRGRGLSAGAPAEASADSSGEEEKKEAHRAPRSALALDPLDSLGSLDLEGFVRAVAELNADLNLDSLSRGAGPVKLAVYLESTSSLVPSGGLRIPLVSGYLDRDGRFVETYRWRPKNLEAEKATC